MRGFFTGRLPRTTRTCTHICGTVQGISDHCGVLLVVEWAEKDCDSGEMTITPVPQNKCVRATNVSSGQITNMRK
jgi:hypothetical protein